MQALSREYLGIRAQKPPPKPTTEAELEPEPGSEATEVDTGRTNEIGMHVVVEDVSDLHWKSSGGHDIRTGLEKELAGIQARGGVQYVVTPGQKARAVADQLAAAIRSELGNHAGSKLDEPMLRAILKALKLGKLLVCTPGMAVLGLSVAVCQKWLDVESEDGMDGLVHTCWTNQNSAPAIEIVVRKCLGAAALPGSLETQWDQAAEMATAMEKMADINR